ncbi:response regulator transcription factor [Salimicrobium sp. PL1-032A]|uniref:response regulator n=1 Tax=Salimicrobium sp. PL1-032A TaxID=3095364 RepID=UPI0032613681
MKQIRILIADDHAVTRDGLKAILEAEKEFKVVAIAQNGEEALRKIAETSPDAILLDGDMPKLNGLQVMELTKEKMENACFLLLSSYHDDRLALEALKKGATGFLLKDWEKEDITRAVQACARGIMIFPDSIAPPCGDRSF